MNKLTRQIELCDKREEYRSITMSFVNIVNEKYLSLTANDEDGVSFPVILDGRQVAQALEYLKGFYNE